MRTTDSKIHSTRQKLMIRPKGFAFFTVVAVCVSVSDARANDYLRTVLLSETPISGPFGQVTTGVDKRLPPPMNPSIGSTGVVSGVSRIGQAGSNQYVAWSEINGQLEGLFALPFSYDSHSESFDVTRLASRVAFDSQGGAIASLGYLNAEFEQRDAITRFTPNTLPVFVAGEDHEIAGADTPTLLAALGSDHFPTLNDSGGIAFGATIRTGTVEQANYQDSVWLARGGEATLVFTSGPNTADDNPLSIKRLHRMRLNGNDEIAIQARASSPTSAWDVDTIWKVGAAGPELIVRSGTPAPGTEGSIVFADQSGDIFGGINLNDSGQVAFSARISQASEPNRPSGGGIWRGTSAADLQPVIMTGDPAPALPDGFQVTQLKPFLMNDAGEIAVSLVAIQYVEDAASGSLTEAGYRSGLFAGYTADDMRLVAEDGPAPDMPAGVNFAPLSQNRTNWPGIAINDAGRVAFGATFYGEGVDASERVGIYAEDRSGRLRLIVRTGDVLDVDDGPGADLRTVKAVNFLSNIAAGYQPHDGFNDAGYLAFSAEFTDGTSGVFVSSAATVPEPAGADLVSIALWAAVFSRRSLVRRRV
ncbi:MAG: hypothetical protein CMJ58_14360 [Planctomycetaceae bacterium]|nr:hypothetical protein [Planctomycetaceae bacterium]